MSKTIQMPALSPTMEEGTLAKWLVKEGDAVSSGDLLAEIETDKATMEFEAVDEGTIAKILVAEGTEGVKVGAVIAILAEEGEDVAQAAKDGGQPDAAPAPKAKAAPAPKAEDRVKASPLARRLAQEKGVDLASVAGSGPNGRIVKADLEGAKPGVAAPAAAPSAPAP
ncbi:biotin/lipoyl-containing protein, partial [Sphingobium baderi]|uniref:biotin/lipoyl-containing protein n=1 Tax=Sphingobium baderi TaxID=1332080 RepID=UPI00065CCFC5